MLVYVSGDMMMSIFDDQPIIRPTAGELAASRAGRIVSLRASVEHMRGLATCCRPGTREQLLRLARDIERHVISLEAVHMNAHA